MAPARRPKWAGERRGCG